MPDERLVEYIKNQLDRDVSLTAIKANLKKVGWKDKDVKDAFEAARVHGIPKPETKEKAKAEAKTVKEEKKEAKTLKEEAHGILERISVVTLHPKHYFESIKSESGFWEPVKYQFVFAFIIVLFMTVILLFASALLAPLTNAVPWLAAIPVLFPIIFLVMWIAIFFPLWLLVVGYFHLFIKLFGGKGNYVQTLKANSYASTPAMLLSWIPFPILGLIALGWSFVLNIIGISELHEISIGRSVLALIAAILAIIVIIVILWFLLFALILGGSF